MDTTSRRKVFSTLSLGTAMAAVGAGTATTASAANTVQSLTTAINTFVPGTGGFVGTLKIPSSSPVSVVGGVLSILGTLSGTVLNGSGGVVGAITQPITVPLQVSGSCQILTLTLGPLDLNLLGLVIHLNQVVLTITAVPGAGNLLGNLLCDVANLLNNPGTLSNLLNGLTRLLNQILGSL